MSVAWQLAERINAMRYDALPAEAVHWSKVAVLDTLGVTLAGSLEAAPRILDDVLALRAGCGPSLVIGTNRRVACLDAALVNGTAALAHQPPATWQRARGEVQRAVLRGARAARRQALVRALRRRGLS